MPEPDLPTIRDLSNELIETVNKYRPDLGEPTDSVAFLNAVEQVFTRLLNRADLITLGVERVANHQPWSSYLYYDGQLSVAMSYLPVGHAIPVHNHGIWEAVSVYRGSVQHRLYQRASEETPDGRAELNLLEDAVLDIGDVRSLTPPADIHGLQGLEEDTYSVGVYLGSYPTNRHYYQPSRGTYLVRNQKQWRSQL